MEVDANVSRGRLLVIGNFDGVHLGHQAVLKGAEREAQESGLLPGVLTFEPHPAAVLGRAPPPLLTTPERKRQLIAEVAPHVELITWPFDLRTAALSPEAFAEQVLVQHLGARVVVVGQNFRFGRGRAGDLATLRELGSRWGFAARAEPLRGDAAGPFSSTRVRELLAGGRVADAALVLGRWHRISGLVGRGDERGRTLGFPTANLEDIEVALPLEGVYCGRALTEAGDVHPAVVSLGPRPTVERPRSVEVHLLDFHGDLYGSRLAVDLVDRLRPVEKFRGLPELVAQIGRDVAQARARLSEPSEKDDPSLSA